VPDITRQYAQSLLNDLGVGSVDLSHIRNIHPAIRWADCGAMALTGRRDGSPRICQAPIASCADGALAALAAIGSRPFPGNLSGANLLGERAASVGFQRNGAISAGGSCHMLKAADGWIALNLARPDDWTMVPALLGGQAAENWEKIAQELPCFSVTELIERGRLLGLAIADAAGGERTRSWFSSTDSGSDRKRPSGKAPLVLDLTGLWAGPLCCHLLQLQGARVIKVENIHRPDGARLRPAFYRLLNAGKESVALDFRTADGLERLKRLIASADIVVESSRPRALRQLGIDVEATIGATPGPTWISITGYGRVEPQANWIAFGDDAGVSAGLSRLMIEPDGSPIFCADAIADPLVGIHAALIAWQRWKSGEGGLISIALNDVAAHCANFDLAPSADAVSDRARRWKALLASRGINATAPTVRLTDRIARPLGADTISVLSEHTLSC
jgi:hypothetical protein